MEMKFSIKASLTPCQPRMTDDTIYDMTVEDCQGNQVPLSKYRNKVLLIVNVASLCGFTPQYIELQKLYQKYLDKGLIILAFPCNQFANQEPLNDEETSRFIRKKFNVTFPIMKKVNVNGKEASKLYTFMKKKCKTPIGFEGVRWNFEKFLINRKGFVVNRYMSETTPLSFENHIINLLNQD